MISFSSLRFSQAAKHLLIFLSGLWLISSLTAQSSEELFRGTWQINTPDEGALILIVKNQGRASYFWGDNTDRSVYQGTWTSTEEAATLTWGDGSQHQIRRNNLGFAITHIGPNGTERYTAAAEQVPEEILGQWAKPPTRENEVASDRDRARGFFGIWKIGDEDDGNIHYVFVESDRSAASTNGDLRGSWAKQGSELHIAWDSGHYSILRESRREFAYKQIQPGQIIEDDETEFLEAVRTIEDNVPSEWLSAYQTEREIYTGGIAFSSRSNARAFYRGDWIVQLNEQSYERIGIARFGGLSTSVDRSLDGDWRMQGQDIFMRWDDGMRKILSPIGRGFVLYEYKPGRPLDGVPTRIRAAAPADSAKLAEHLRGREDVAEQMFALAEAAGIDPAQQQEAGWGRTFARWAWPFGEDEAATSQDLLQQEFEVARESDPWWWPFWSEGVTTPAPIEDSQETEETIEEASTPLEEIQATETAIPAEEATEASIPIDVIEEVNEELQEGEKEQDTPSRSTSRDWTWPF